MSDEIWTVQALAPFAVNGIHHDENDAAGNPALYSFPKEIAAQVIAAGRARRVQPADPAA